MNTEILNSPHYWDEKYNSNNTGWDIKSSNPVFVDLLKENKLIKPSKILITGSGKGYDAVAAAKENYDVTAVDFSKKANELAGNLADENSVKINFITEDIFDLMNNYKNYFDAVYEYTTFCAIKPARRKEYAKVMSEIIKPGGKLIALLFPVDGRPGGPPFNIDILEFYNFFSKYFIMEISTFKINSIKPRKGKEVLQVYRKK